jgi:hypothetical protein
MANSRVPRVARVCQNPACGKAFTVRPWVAARGWGRYCCRACTDPFTTAAAREAHWGRHGSALWRAAGEADRLRTAGAR